MNNKRITPAMKIREEISEIISGMKTEPVFYEDPFQKLMLKSKELVIQEMLEQEATDHLGREPYQRDEEKVYTSGYRNGYEPKKIKTPEGKIGLQIPQVRGGEEPYRSKLKTFLEITRTS